MSDQAWQQWFEGLWADREERLYRQFFGDLGPGIFSIPASMFQTIDVPDPDPRYLFHGVFECPPSAGRDHWVYVTSGMSNPWGESPETVDPAGFSGLGYEFTLHTRQQARWPIRVLHWVMAVQLAIASGLREGELLQRNDRINLGSPLPVTAPSGAPGGGNLTHLLVTTPDLTSMGMPGAAGDPRYPAEFTLASGRVEMMLLVGITQREADFARTQSPEGLLTLLRHHEIFPLTDAARASAV